MITLKSFGKAVSLFFLIFLAACETTPNKNQRQYNAQQMGDFLSKIDGHMFADNKASNHVGDIRQYLLDNANFNIGKKELDIINKTEPVITKNNNTLEYCFYWKMPNKTIIEVITSPPPQCEPLTVSRTNRVYYP